MSFQNIEDAARAACAQVGIDYRVVPHDGRFHVADITNDPRGKNDGKIQITVDGQRVQAFNYKSGERVQMFLNSDSYKPMSDADKARIERERRKRQAQEAARMNRAAFRALTMWQAATPATVDHPYLIGKQIQPHATRVSRWKRVATDAEGNKQTIIIDNALLIPLFGATGKIRSLQAIFPTKHPLFERNKDFLPGGGLAGLFWWIGARTDSRYHQHDDIPGHRHS